MIKKRMKALALAGVFLLCSVVPVRQANAVLPIAIGMTMQAFGAGGSLVSANLLTAGVSALIGGTIFALGLTPSDMGDGTNPVGLRIPTIDDPVKSDQAMPVLNNAPAIKPMQEISGYLTGCLGAEVYFGPSLSDACSAGGGTVFNNGTNDYCASSRAGCGTIATTRSVVPAGYGNCTASGCVLLSPRAAAPDQKYDVKRTASGYELPIPALPGSTLGEADSKPAYASSSGGKIQVAGRDSSGRPVMIEYAVSPDGTKTYITHYTQTEVGGQSVVNSQSVTIDASTGAVTGAAGATAAGSISGVGTASPAVTTTGAAVAPADIVFPSDYARAGEAANAANVVKGAVDALAEPLKKTETLNDPTVPDYVDPWNTTFSMLKGWSLPGHSSSCPVGSFEWNGGLYAIDAHCQLVADHFGVIQAAMSVVWVVLALFVVLGA